MKSKTVPALAAALLAGLALTSTQASAAPAPRGIAHSFDKVPVTYVRYRGGHHGYHARRYGYRPYYRHHYRRHGFGPGLGLGLATGAIIGGALAAQSAAPAPVYAAPAPVYDGNAVAYCEQKFRSYDPASGTYLGYDGERHPCP